MGQKHEINAGLKFEVVLLTRSKCLERNDIMKLSGSKSERVNTRKCEQVGGIEL
jgi:hypothetical protein